MKAYRGKRDRHTPDNEMFMALAEYFNLDYRYDVHYANGIAILPDDYRPYYEKQKWAGIFESDKKAAWEWWINEGRAANGWPPGGNTSGPEVESIRSTSPRAVQFVSEHYTSDGAQTISHVMNGGGQSLSGQTPKSEKGLYEFIEMFADAHPQTNQPYFKLLFKHQDEEVAIYAVDERIMAYLDEVLREGGKYRLKTKKSERGSLILRHITRAS